MLKTFCEILLDYLSILFESENRNYEMNARVDALVAWMRVTYAEFDELMKEIPAGSADPLDDLYDLIKLFLGPKEA